MKTADSATTPTERAPMKSICATGSSGARRRRGKRRATGAQEHRQSPASPTNRASIRPAPPKRRAATRPAAGTAWAGGAGLSVAAMSMALVVSPVIQARPVPIGTADDGGRRAAGLRTRCARRMRDADAARERSRSRGGGGASPGRQQLTQLLAEERLVNQQPLGGLAHSSMKMMHGALLARLLRTGRAPAPRRRRRTSRRTPVTSGESAAPGPARAGAGAPSGSAAGLASSAPCARARRRSESAARAHSGSPAIRRAV